MEVSGYEFKYMCGMTRREKQQRRKKFIQKLEFRIESLHNMPDEKKLDWEKEQLEPLVEFTKFMKRQDRDFFFYLLEHNLVPTLEWYPGKFKRDVNQMVKDTYVARIYNIGLLDIE